jgi:hypothetical protein
MAALRKNDEDKYLQLGKLITRASKSMQRRDSPKWKILKKIRNTRNVPFLEGSP